MNDHNVGDKCPKVGCEGSLEIQEQEGSCSCHIHPPCSHCCHGMIECDSCEFEHDSMDSLTSAKPIPGGIPKQYIRIEKTLADLKKGTFDYLTIPGTYYFMEYKGYYPEGWTADDLKSKFNICFGYTNFSMKDGQFNIKVYTD